MILTYFIQTLGMKRTWSLIQSIQSGKMFTIKRQSNCSASLRSDSILGAGVGPSWDKRTSSGRAMVALGWSIRKTWTWASTTADTESTLVRMITLEKSIVQSKCRQHVEVRVITSYSPVKTLPSLKSRCKFNASTVTIKCRNANRLSWVKAAINGQGRAAPVLSHRTCGGLGFKSAISFKARPTEVCSSSRACLPCRAATRSTNRPGWGFEPSSDNNSHQLRIHWGHAQCTASRSPLSICQWRSNVFTRTRKPQRTVTGIFVDEVKTSLQESTSLSEI